MKIRIAGIVKNSVVDGPGLRYVIFAQGCGHNCLGCHNPHTHALNGGEEREIGEIAAEIKSDPLISGVTFSGGEPFEQPEAFAKLADLLPETNVICYSGYTFEELLTKPNAGILLQKIDVLIDGRFDITQKSYDLRFRGSANQRVLNAKESVKSGGAVEITL